MNKLEAAFAHSDDTLIGNLDVLAETDREVGADIVAHLAALEDRGLHLDLGYSSLFVYATERLGFEREVAYKRIRAARVARRFPQVIAAIESGELSLSTLVLLAPELLSKNPRVELIEQAKGKSKQEVKELLSSNWIRIQLTRLELHVDEEFLQKLELAKALYAHQIPDGNLEQLFSKALDALLMQGEKKRFAQTEAPRPQKPTKTLPAAVKRSVYARDHGRCSFVSEDGRRCNETAFLEFDHKHPRALGGTHDETNIRLLCRGHNQRAAEHIFGKAHMTECRGANAQR